MRLIAFLSFDVCISDPDCEKYSGNGSGGSGCRGGASEGRSARAVQRWCPGAGVDCVVNCCGCYCCGCCVGGNTPVKQAPLAYSGNGYL